MKTKRLHLACGHVIEVIAINIKRTYGEIIESSPNYMDNEYVRDKLDFPIEWGVRKAIYADKHFHYNKEAYRPYIVCMWFSSHKSVNDPNKEYDGSEVVVMWTINDIINFSVENLMSIGLKEFDWEKYAKNFKL